MLEELKEEKNSRDPKKLVCVKSSKTIFDFNISKYSLDFAADIYHGGKNLLREAKNALYKILEQLQDLKKYNPINPDKINSREETLINGKKLYTEIMSLRHLKTKFFRLKMDFTEKSQISLINYHQIGKK